MESPYKSNPQTPDASDDDLDVEAILYEDLQVPSGQDLETVIKSKLHNDTENIEPDSVEDRIIYGNPKGHGLLQDFAELRRRIMIIESQNVKQANEQNDFQRQLQDKSREITKLQGAVRTLVKTSDDYLKIRQRFLETFKRDIKGIDTKGSKSIREGNSKAHNGDAQADAMLFDRDNRNDGAIYKELYGMDYRKVIEYQSGTEDESIFLILNAHATALARKELISENTKAAFELFLSRVKEAWLEPPTSDPKSPLGLAYYNFWKMFNEQA